MKIFTLLLFTITFTLPALSQIISPSVIASAGGCDENAYAKISWTLGETITETETNGEYILTQGFQQAHFNVISVQETIMPGYSVNVYPNPFTSSLNIDFSTPDNSEFQLILFDASGKIITNCHNNSNSTYVMENLSQLASGLYFLKTVSTNSKFDKTFKIEKTGY